MELLTVLGIVAIIVLAFLAILKVALFIDGILSDIRGIKDKLETHEFKIKSAKDMAEEGYHRNREDISSKYDFLHKEIERKCDTLFDCLYKEIEDLRDEKSELREEIYRIDHYIEQIVKEVKATKNSFGDAKAHLKRRLYKIEGAMDTFHQLLKEHYRLSLEDWSDEDEECRGDSEGSN